MELEEKRVMELGAGTSLVGIFEKHFGVGFLCCPETSITVSFSFTDGHYLCKNALVSSHPIYRKISLFLGEDHRNLSSE